MLLSKACDENNVERAVAVVEVMKSLEAQMKPLKARELHSPRPDGRTHPTRLPLSPPPAVLHR